MTKIAANNRKSSQKSKNNSVILNCQILKLSALTIFVFTVIFFKSHCKKFSFTAYFPTFLLKFFKIFYKKCAMAWIGCVRCYSKGPQLTMQDGSRCTTQSGVEQDNTAFTVISFICDTGVRYSSFPVKNDADDFRQGRLKSEEI